MRLSTLSPTTMKTTKNDSTIADIDKLDFHTLATKVKKWFDDRNIDTGYTDKNVGHFAIFIQEITAQALQRKDEEWKEKVQGLKMEKLYNPKPSFLQDTQLPYERYEDYDERKRFIYTDKNKKYGYNQAVDELQKRIEEYENEST